MIPFPKIKFKGFRIVGMNICPFADTVKTEETPYSDIFRLTTCFSVRKSYLQNFCYARRENASLAMGTPRNKKQKFKSLDFLRVCTVARKISLYGVSSFEV